MGTIGYSGVLIGPALLGLLADRFGLEMIFSFVGVLTLVMCALCWYILRANSKRMVTDNQLSFILNYWHKMPVIFLMLKIHRLNSHHCFFLCFEQ